MNFQFPNARLFVRDLIATEQLSGPEAMVQAAYEFGLVPVNSKYELHYKHRDNTQCPCFATAKTILETHLAPKIETGSIQIEKVADIWSGVKRQAELYQKLSPETGNMTDEELCARMAPALFDLILQEVRRYS